MDKKIIIAIFIIAGLFLSIVFSIGFAKVYKYYYSLPYIVPKGKIIFTSNRLNKYASSTHVLENGNIRNSGGGLWPRFIRSTGEVVSWGGATDNALYISDKYLFNFKKLEFTKKLDISYFDISPDGKQICFVSTLKLNKPDLKQSPYNLFVVNMDGTGLKQLTNLERAYFRTASYPRWSPNGEKIIFEYPTDPSAKESPSVSIYSIDPNGNNLKDMIGDAPTFKTLRVDPTLSPDSSKIAFVSYEHIKDSYNVYLMNSDGSNIVQLTNSPYHKRQPVFSPDGKQICYVGYPQGLRAGSQLFIVDLETKKEYRVTKPERVKVWPGQAADRDPDWHE